MTQNNLKIAITGGIGSGKSTVSKIIEEQGLPVFSCDKIYNELLSDKSFLKKIEESFVGVLNENGTLNRQMLSEIVFNDSEKLKILNGITHSEIMSAAFKKMEGYNLSFLEVPLLFENSFESLFDGVIVVLRDREERVNSVVARDKITKEMVLKRLKSQFNYDKFDFAEYYVIHNNCNLSELSSKTLEILQKINKKFS